MSRTTDYLLTLKGDLENAATLHDVLLLDVKYCGENGTDTVVQDLFREEKYNYVMDGLKKVGLDVYAFRFYNYSMQGKCQMYLKNHIQEELINNLDALAEYYDLNLNKDCISRNRDYYAVVLNLEV